MKKFLFLLIGMLSFVLSSCSKNGQFFMGYTSSITVSSTFGQLVPFAINTPEITSNAESEFSANKTSKERITSIKLSELKLTITSPDGETFSFLNSLEIHLSASGLAEKKIAYLYSIPSTVGNEISCSVVVDDLQEYIKKDSFKVKAVFTTDETLAQDVVIDIKPRFLVKAKIRK